MYIISRYWNRLAYLIMNIGRKMLWDYTKKNKDLLLDPFHELSKMVFTKF